MSKILGMFAVLAALIAFAPAASAAQKQDGVRAHADQYEFSAHRRYYRRHYRPYYRPYYYGYYRPYYRPYPYYYYRPWGFRYYW